VFFPLRQITTYIRALPLAVAVAADLRLKSCPSDQARPSSTILLRSARPVALGFFFCRERRAKVMPPLSDLRFKLLEMISAHGQRGLLLGCPWFGEISSTLVTELVESVHGRGLSRLPATAGSAVRKPALGLKDLACQFARTPSSTWSRCLEQTCAVSVIGAAGVPPGYFFKACCAQPSCFMGALQTRQRSLRAWPLLT